MCDGMWCFVISCSFLPVDNRSRTVICRYVIVTELIHSLLLIDFIKIYIRVRACVILFVLLFEA